MTSFGLKFEQKLPYNKFLVDQVNKLYKSFPESAKLEKFREALIDRERKKLEQ